MRFTYKIHAVPLYGTGRDLLAMARAEVATPAPTAQLDPLRIRTNVELAAIELSVFQKAGLMNLEAMKANILARQPGADVGRREYKVRGPILFALIQANVHPVDAMEQQEGQQQQQPQQQQQQQQQRSPRTDPSPASRRRTRRRRTAHGEGR